MILQVVGKFEPRSSHDISQSYYPAQSRFPFGKGNPKRVFSLDHGSRETNELAVSIHDTPRGNCSANEVYNCLFKELG